MRSWLVVAADLAAAAAGAGVLGWLFVQGRVPVWVLVGVGGVLAVTGVAIARTPRST